MSSDISKCKGTNCPLKEECKRFLVPSNIHQSWILPYYDKVNNDCEFLIKILKNG